MDLNLNSRKATKSPIWTFLDFYTVSFELCQTFYTIFDSIGFFFLYMCGKIIKGLKFLHFSLTFLSFSSKANINEVKWILYKGKAVVGWEDQPFLNQTSITSVGFSLKIREIVERLYQF